MTIEDLIRQLAASREAMIATAFLSGGGEEAADKLRMEIDEALECLRGAQGCIETLTELEIKEEQWARRWRADKGATAADCIQFLQHNMRKLGMDPGLAATMERRFYERCIKHLEELGERRKAMEEEVNRRERESRSRWQEEAQQRAYEQVHEKARRAGAYANPFEQAFGQQGYEDLLRETMGRFGFKFHQRSGLGAAPPAGAKKRWFEVLGVAPGADAQAIKAAARRLRSQFHPDRYKGEDAHARIVEINVAYDEGISACPQ